MACPAAQTFQQGQISSRPTKSILLIEDNEEAMLLVRAALQQHANGLFHLKWAQDLTKGLDSLSHNEVDLVLLDLELPEYAGSATFAWVRELAPRLPIIVLTADASQNTKSTLLASGAHNYLVKGEVSGRQLVQSIQSAFIINNQVRHATAEPDGPPSPRFQVFSVTPPSCN